MDIEKLIASLSNSEKEKALVILTNEKRKNGIAKELIPIKVFVSRHPEMSTRLQTVLMKQHENSIKYNSSTRYINEMITYHEFRRCQLAGPITWKELKTLLIKDKLL